MSATTSAGEVGRMTLRKRRKRADPVMYESKAARRKPARAKKVKNALKAENRTICNEVIDLLFCLYGSNITYLQFVDNFIVYPNFLRTVSPAISNFKEFKFLEVDIFVVSSVVGKK